MTQYRVLRQVEKDVFRVVAREIEGSGSHNAIRQVAVKATPPHGVYVAVPESNWTEEPVSVEPREPLLRIGGQVSIEEALAEDAKGGE